MTVFRRSERPRDAMSIVQRSVRLISESFPIFEILLFLFDFLGVRVFLLSLFVLELDNLFVVTVIVAVVIVMVLLHDMDGNRI